MAGRSVGRYARAFLGQAGRTLAVLCLCMATALAGTDPMAWHREVARHAGLEPCRTVDLDCRAFTGVLAWQPDERRPVLSSRALRQLALLRWLNGSERERALRCIAIIAWAEARSDGVAGMRAVMAVVLNRSHDVAFPTHPCAVVAQAGAFEPMVLSGYRTTAAALRKGRLPPFPRPVSAVDAAALGAARLLAWNLAQRPAIMDPTKGATHFLAPAVLRARGMPLPNWARQFPRTTRIGGHHFFRQPRAVATAE